MQQDLIQMTARIVSSYVASNALPAANLPALIASIHGALTRKEENDKPVVELAEKLKPAVPIRKSVSDDYLVCLEDGRKFKTLKRHLAQTYNMTPGAYRAKWGLPKTYPMVAPSYAASRAYHARLVGLGRRRVQAEAKATEIAQNVPPQTENLADIPERLVEPII